ncbi:hypothetical protein D046_5641, partial [Vibrio parahaemolyticus V-223/04]
SLFLIAS